MFKFCVWAFCAGWQVRWSSVPYTSREICEHLGDTFFKVIQAPHPDILHLHRNGRKGCSANNAVSLTYSQSYWSILFPNLGSANPRKHLLWLFLVLHSPVSTNCVGFKMLQFLSRPVPLSSLHTSELLRQVPLSPSVYDSIIFINTYNNGEIIGTTYSSRFSCSKSDTHCSPFSPCISLQGTPPTCLCLAGEGLRDFQGMQF